jgi:peptidoglycan/xylan/chitin deacetylase (PgdA/CDA1 family)/GT2 family glycosyltransferase
VVRGVRALERQHCRDFEVIVVDDGSRDGTATALRALETSFPLTVLEQGNAGAAAARNAGADRARGELLLFLDDDMEAHPALLEEHASSHGGGAEIVLGDLPLHPDSPRSMLSWGVGRWAADRRRRLLAPGAPLGVGDLLTGQLSISRELFARIGGFDDDFTRGGRFGGEDIDFGTRVLAAGHRVAFNANAVSWQYYDVDPADYLRRSRDAGRAREALMLKHPERAPALAAGPRFHTRTSRWLLGPLVVAPPALSRPVRALAVALVRTGRTGVRARRLFFAARTLEHRRGARAARRALASRRVAVLAYHAVEDLRGDPVLHEYGVPAERFAAQLDALARRGFRFVRLDAVLDALRGEDRLPRRAVLVTFDDCYASVLAHAAPALARRGIPAVAFAVSGLIGATNEWDRALGARPLPLLDADGLRTLRDREVELGSHGVSHRRLPSLPPGELAAELEGSAAALQSLGVPRPRAFAYPYGESTAATAAAARAAGYRAAFTVRPGWVRPGGDPHALPRIEVLASDTPRRLLLKLAAARAPERRRALILALRPIVR